MGFIYLPSQDRQIVPTDKWGKYNCGAAATADAIDRATIGGVMVDAKDVRAATDEPIPDPHSPGLNIPQLAKAAAKFHVSLIAVRGGSFDSVLARLKEGRGVVISGLGSALGPNTCQPGFTGGHAIFLNNLSTDQTKIVVYNPLCPNRRYLTVGTVRKYAEAFGAANGGLAYAYTRITPNVTALSN